MEECRLRDPPQAENPASQDSFLHNFQVPGIIELRIIGKIMLEPRRENVPGHILFYRKSGCAGACRQAVAAHSIKGKDREKT